METGRLAFTAVYLKSNSGYIGFIEELPGVNSHGRTIDEARETLLRECARLCDEPVSAEELSRAARYSIGAHAIAQQNGAVVLGEMIDAWLLGEGLEELGEFEARVGAVTARDIQEFAAASFDPARRVEGVVRGRGGRAGTGDRRPGTG